MKKERLYTHFKELVGLLLNLTRIASQRITALLFHDLIGTVPRPGSRSRGSLSSRR